MSGQKRRHVIAAQGEAQSAMSLPLADEVLLDA